MKAKITAEELKQLGPGWDNHYGIQADGSYKLIVEGGFLDEQDPQLLKNTIEHLRKEKEEIGLKLKTIEGSAQTEAQKAAEEAAKAKAEAEALAIKKGDLEAITTALKNQMTEQQTKFEQELLKRDEATKSRLDALRNNVIKQGAGSIAKELFGDQADVLVANFIPRLDVDDANNLVFKDKNGQIDPSYTVDKFKQEILDDPRYAPIIVASRASGAGGTHDKGSPVDTSNRTFDDLSSDERVKLHREDPTKYNQLQQTATKSPIKL